MRVVNDKTNITPDLRKGCLYIILGFFFMAAFGAFTKEATLKGSELWASIICYAVSLLIQTLVVGRAGFEILKTQHFSFHFCRAFFGVTASLLYFVAMYYIPLLNATLLFNTTPIFIPILAIFMLGESVTPKIWFSIFVGFIGILFIIRPDASSFGQPGDFIGLASGFFLAVAFVYVKKLTKTDSPNTINFYFFCIATLLQIPLLFFFGNFPSQKTILLSICGGLMLFLMQTFIVKAYQYAEASKIGVFQYSSVVFVGIIDWLIWGIVPSWTVYVGIILVVMAGGMILRNQQSGVESQKG